MESFVRRTSFILVFFVTLVFCLPINKRFPVVPSNDQIVFMQKYGYLGGDPASGFEAQYSEDSIVEAIINIQKFGGIEQTGVFDNKTKELMKKPRCGVKDVIYKSREKRFSVIRGWRKRKLTYHVGNWNQNLGESRVRSEIKRALDMWAPYGRLTFTPSSDPSSDIKILFGSGDHGDSYPFDGRGLVLAHAFFPHVRDGGSVHFDNDELWTWNVTDPYAEGTDFFSVAVHELGHALGLGHSQVEDSIMFAYYKGQPMELNYDDVMGMYDLYFRRFDAIDESGDNSVDTSRESDHTEETPVTEASTTEFNRSPEPTTTIHGITYEGDYESIDDHKKHDDKHGIPRTYENTSELCMGKYDTISVIRRELYVFKDTTIWRFQRKGVLYDGYPTSLFHMFPNLPLDIKRIDAAYENIDGEITFFSGTKYWIYDFKNYNAYNLENYGVRDSAHINAVLLWPVNNKTYLFGQNTFWRFNEATNTLDSGYPKSMTRWRGIPNDIDAAITWIDGSTYLFKGMFYWRFNSNFMAADANYPFPVPQKWFGCTETPEVFQELRKLRNQRVKIKN